MTMAAVNVQAMFIIPRSHSPALAERSVEPLPRLPDAPPPEPAVDSFQGGNSRGNNCQGQSPLGLVYRLVYKAQNLSQGLHSCQISRLPIRNKRADERTRTPDLISLPVIIQALRSFAWACRHRPPKEVPLNHLTPCLEAVFGQA